MSPLDLAVVPPAVRARVFPRMAVSAGLAPRPTQIPPQAARSRAVAATIASVHLHEADISHPSGIDFTSEKHTPTTTGRTAVPEGLERSPELKRGGYIIKYAAPRLRTIPHFTPA